MKIKKRDIFGFIGLVVFTFSGIHQNYHAEKSNTIEEVKQELEEKAKKTETTELMDRYNGEWVNDTVQTGYEKVNLVFIDVDTAVMTYKLSNDYYPDVVVVHETVDFKKVETTKAEEDYYEASFTYEEDGYGNSGSGFVVLNAGEVELYNNRISHGHTYGGTEGLIAFKRAEKPKLFTSLEMIERTVNMHEQGYLPNDKVVYRYKSIDGTSHKTIRYYNEGYKIYASKGPEMEGYYEFHPLGILFYERDFAYDAISFPIEKGNKWGYEFEGKKEERKIIDTNYNLVGATEDVVVLAINEKEVEYYHKDYGLIGFGEMNEIGNHMPTYLLDEVSGE